MVEHSLGDRRGEDSMGGEVVDDVLESDMFGDQSVRGLEVVVQPSFEEVDLFGIVLDCGSGSRRVDRCFLETNRNEVDQPTCLYRLL